MSVKHVRCNSCDKFFPLVEKKIPEHMRRTFNSFVKSEDFIPNWKESLCPGGYVDVHEPEEIEFNLESR